MLKVIELRVSIKSTRRETHVILKPINGPNFVDMTFKLVMRRAFSGIEIVDLYAVGMGTCEQVSTMTELDLS